MTMRDRTKAAFRRSAFAVGALRALRGAATDLRVIGWILARRRKIDTYLKSAPVRKLHLGASRNHLSGWLNADIYPLDAGILYLDVTIRFPFGDSSFDYIFFEHLIEHIDFQDGMVMLRECWRVLKPN